MRVGTTPAVTDRLLPRARGRIQLYALPSARGVNMAPRLSGSGRDEPLLSAGAGRVGGHFPFL